MDEDVSIDSEFASLLRDRHRPYPTLIVVFHIFISLGGIVFGYLLRYNVFKFGKPCDNIAQCFLYQLGHWIICVIFVHYYTWRNNFLKLDGHFTLHKKMNRLASLIVATVSITNAIMIMMMAIFYLIKQDEPSLCSEQPFQLGIYYCPIIGGCICFYLLSMILAEGLKFNRFTPISDLDQLEHQLISARDDGVGYRNRGEEVVELLEKYSSLLNYYKDLSSELMQRNQA